MNVDGSKNEKLRNTLYLFNPVQTEVNIKVLLQKLSDVNICVGNSDFPEFIEQKIN